MAQLVQYLTVWNPSDWRVWPTMAVPVNRHETETVGQVKQKVAGIYGLHGKDFDVVYRHRVLEDETKSLADYGVIPYAYVEVRVKG